MIPMIDRNGPDDPFETSCVLLRKISSSRQKSAHCKGDVTMLKSFIEVSEGSPQKNKEKIVEKLRVTESEHQHYPISLK